LESNKYKEYIIINLKMLKFGFGFGKKNVKKDLSAEKKVIKK